MFDVNNPLLVGLIDNRVCLLLRLVVMSLEDALLRAHQKDRPALGLELRRHQRAQVESERDEPLLFRFQPLDQRLAGVSVAVDYGQRAAFEGQLRSVLQPDAVHRAVSSRGLVVDRDALAFHLGLQDRDKRGAVASHGDRLLDAVFEKLAHFAAGGRGLDARFTAGDGAADAGRGRGGRHRAVGEFISLIKLLIELLAGGGSRRRRWPCACQTHTSTSDIAAGAWSIARSGATSYPGSSPCRYFARLVNLRIETQILRDRDDWAIAIKRILDRLNERNRSPRNQRQRNVLPVLFANVVNDSPTLKERLALRVEHDPIGRFPYRRGDRIADDHLALSIAFGRYSDGLRVAASRGGRGAGELRDVLPRAFVQQFDRAHVIQIEALQFAGVGRDHERVSFDRRLFFFSRKLPFADGENGPDHAAIRRCDGHARAL